MTDTARTVFVVLGEVGEYSDRIVWVSAVFATREEAEDAVTRRSAAYRHHEQWELNRAEALSREAPRRTLGGGYTPEQKARVAERVGPEPEIELASRFEIVEIEIGVWNNGMPSDD